MKKTLTFLLPLSLLFAVFSGCFHKSVMKDEADDIVTAKIYNFKDGKYLVMLESIFQATSKKSGGGINVTTGYNDLRISVYDLSTGSLVCREATGTMIDHAITFLGCSEGKLWFYSLDDGLHARNPKTLEIIVTQDDFFAKNSTLKDNLAKCEWYQYPQFFQFDELTQKLIISDNQGFRYSVEPKTLASTKLPENFKMPSISTDDPFDSYLNFVDEDISLNGDLRKQVKLRSKEINPAITFLDGKFIADRNNLRLYNLLSKEFEPIKKEWDRLEALKKGMEKEGRRPEFSSPQWKIYRNIEDSLREIENKKNDLERSLNYLKEYGRLTSDERLLQSDTTTFFVFHKTNTAKDANVIISCLQIKGKSTLKELWKTTLPDLFFDPSAAEETDSFQKVFSKGNPQFSFQFIELVDGKLIVVFMLHVHCIDVKSGKVLWKMKV